MRPDVTRQLALYHAFHRDVRNRCVHAVFVPIVMVSGLFLVAPLGLSFLHLGTVLVLGYCALLATIDRFAPRCSPPGSSRAR